MYIDVNCPDYLGAPQPEFNELMCNESEFPHRERAKECMLKLNEGRGEAVDGEVEWLTQGSRKPSAKFNAEILRAFKANGAAEGTVIHVAYGIRDDGLTEKYDLVVK